MVGKQEFRTNLAQLCVCLMENTVLQGEDGLMPTKYIQLTPGGVRAASDHL